MIGVDENSGSVALGIDVGTTGVRAVAIDGAKHEVARADTPMSEAGPNPRDPKVWWGATIRTLEDLMRRLDGERIAAIAVDGTSGTLLPVDKAGNPLGNALMYNDVVTTPEAIADIAAHAPETSAAHGPTSGLLKVVRLQDTKGTQKVIHQADWIAGCLSGRFDVSDENNALKTGYDPIERRWPDWLDRTAARRALLPEVAEPGSVIGEITREAAAFLGISPRAVIAAGTTDGCASFLATGAEEPGDAVTALGSTLVLKMLSDKPLFAPEYGLYSHRIGDRWLAGGASNSGGAVLAKYFSPEQMRTLSTEINPDAPLGYDYYPLATEGERFPINDPELQPRLEPRPLKDAQFLQALLEGVTAVEVLGYQRLKELGAPELRSLRTVGGGAQNPTWTAIRQRVLPVPFLAPASQDAAAGTARLALAAARGAGLI
ncbi:FGGY-family carbohydrate kinase [Denitrobaculum tricleocarpae]|uniref:FGGY-family carbohydrate kinase n=1 Tax=Denitrobaculum tricleocarpae TaxID=2591009 RepID=UPI001FE9F209|nr:FGGY-family carbohydrate kinase [Denitrobaculum tricleocarpae]